MSADKQLFLTWPCEVSQNVWQVVPELQHQLAVQTVLGRHVDVCRTGYEEELAGTAACSRAALRQAQPGDVLQRAGEL